MLLSSVSGNGAPTPGFRMGAPHKMARIAQSTAAREAPADHAWATGRPVAPYASAIAHARDERVSVEHYGLSLRGERAGQPPLPYGPTDILASVPGACRAAGELVQLRTRRLALACTTRRSALRSIAVLGVTRAIVRRNAGERRTVGKDQQCRRLQGVASVGSCRARGSPCRKGVCPSACSYCVSRPCARHFWPLAFQHLPLRRSLHQPFRRRACRWHCPKRLLSWSRRMSRRPGPMTPQVWRFLPLVTKPR